MRENSDNPKKRFSLSLEKVYLKHNFMSNIYPGVWERLSLPCYLSAALCCGIPVIRSECKALAVSYDSVSRRLESWTLQISGLVLSSLLWKTEGSVEMNSVVLSNYKACGSFFPLSISGSWKRLSLDSDPDGCLTCWQVAGRQGCSSSCLWSLTFFFS